MQTILFYCAFPWICTPVCRWCNLETNWSAAVNPTFRWNSDLCLVRMVPHLDHIGLSWRQRSPWLQGLPAQTRLHTITPGSFAPVPHLADSIFSNTEDVFVQHRSQQNKSVCHKHLDLYAEMHSVEQWSATHYHCPLDAQPGRMRTFFFFWRSRREMSNTLLYCVDLYTVPMLYTLDDYFKIR